MMQNKMLDDVCDFHVKFGVPVKPSPGFPDDTRIALRSNLVVEEIRELLEAIGNDDIVGTADGIADAIYVLIGMAMEFGIPLELVWNEVHRSNMTKVGGAIREDGKILKPEGWEPPDIASCLGL